MFSITPRTGACTCRNICDAAPDVGERHVLRRRHDHAARDRHLLRERELHVAGAGRQVDHEHVELAPVDVAQELGDELGQHRAAPDDRASSSPTNMPIEITREAVALDGRSRCAVAGCGPCSVDAEHERDARPVDVGVHQPDARAERRERQRPGWWRPWTCRRRPCRSRPRARCCDAGDRLPARGARPARGACSRTISTAPHAGDRRDRGPDGGLDLCDDLLLGGARGELDGHACRATPRCRAPARTRRCRG